MLLSLSKFSLVFAVTAALGLDQAACGLARALATQKKPATAPVTGRDLKSYYSRRAFLGAPPVIAHEIDPDMQSDLGDCLVCHESGEGDAPVTPHPQFLSCRQCHVPMNQEKLFKDIDWKSVSPPKLHKRMLPGSPPPMPHQLRGRESCLACHDGPAAVREIRTPHPERTSCPQCHVEVETEKAWERSGES
ncbi:MAG: hypothetical protein HY537_05495 [Deltaproteobacteria bacterium]|nr:hypothetical protein [Deltaproteobacteria bacterium]